MRLAGTRRVIYSRTASRPCCSKRSPRTNLTASLYVVLDWAGHAVEPATARLTPTVADGPEGAHLEVAPGTPLLRIEQPTTTAPDVPVMLSDEWHVADAFTARSTAAAARPAATLSPPRPAPPRTALARPGRRPRQIAPHAGLDRRPNVFIHWFDRRSRPKPVSS